MNGLSDKNKVTFLTDTLFIKLKPDINKEDLHESKLIKSPNKENNFDENDYQTPSYNNKQFHKVNIQNYFNKIYLIERSLI